MSGSGITRLGAIVAAAAFCGAWTLRGPVGTDPGRLVDAGPVFVEADRPWRGAEIRTDPSALAAVARSTLTYIDAHPHTDPSGVHPGLPGELGVTLEDVRATLALVVSVAEEDRGQPSQRLLDAAFLDQSFRTLSWRSDRAGAAARGVSLDDDRIRLTRYLAIRVPGRAAFEPGFPCALYAVPDDEGGLDVDEAELRRGELDRFRYTRREVLDGVYVDGVAAGRARPLVWLDRAGVHDALMQGTVVVAYPDGGERTFNVDRSNGMAWRPEVARTPELQDRTWYFREVSGLMGWGRDANDKIPVVPGVTVAGDIENLGLGKLIALRYPGAHGEVVRLAILADSGGAFQPNLFQLDWLAGAFASRQELAAATADLPERVAASLLVAR
jgi:hypothetical protein